MVKHVLKVLQVVINKSFTYLHTVQYLTDVSISKSYRIFFFFILCYAFATATFFKRRHILLPSLSRRSGPTDIELNQTSLYLH